MKSRVIQEEPQDPDPATGAVQPERIGSGARSPLADWVREHRLAVFFGLAYLLAWWPWPLYSLGLLPESLFFAIGPLLAAIVVIAVAEGRPGFRDLWARMTRWRVAWYWYAVAIGLPLAVLFGSTLVNVILFAAPAPEWSQLAWSSFLLAFAIRLVNPLDGALGEEPGWRGFALPRMQARHSPLFSAAILGLLVAGWHLPLAFDGLGAVGIASTVVITFVYVWLFNRTGGSVLLTLLFHSTQGAVTMGDLGFTGADIDRQAWIQGIAWTLIAAFLLLIDRSVWRAPARTAVYPPLSARSYGETD